MKKQIPLLILGILFLSIGTVSANPQMPENALRGTYNYWVVPEALKTNIDYLVSIGGNTMLINTMTKDYIIGLKNGNPDPIADAIKYADTKGVRIVISTSMTTYAANREAFFSDTVAQQAWLNDLEWILIRYPTLDGITLEEAQSYNTAPVDGGLKARTVLNRMFSSAQVIIKKHHNIDDIANFEFSVNIATNTEPGISNVGFDTKYITDNNLFNVYHIQSPEISLYAYQKSETDWSARLPNLAMSGLSYLTTSALLNTPGCKSSINWNSPDCWNQHVFETLQWAHQNHKSSYVFVQSRLSRPASMWPGVVIPGNTAGEKVKYIWGSGGIITPTAQPTIQPTVQPTHTITPIETSPPLSGGSMSVSSNPPRAKIIVNNQPMGVTNRTGDNKINLPASPFYVKIVKDGYKTITDFGVILPGKTLDKTYDLQPVNKKNWFQAWIDSILGLN